MTTVRHVAHAVGSTGSTVPAYRVSLRVGPHELVADEPTAAGGGAVGPSPFGLLVDYFGIGKHPGRSPRS